MNFLWLVQFWENYTWIHCYFLIINTQQHHKHNLTHLQKHRTPKLILLETWNHTLECSMDGNLCKFAFHLFHPCILSAGSSLSQSNFCFHISWMISLALYLAGVNIPRLSNMEPIKLRIPLWKLLRFNLLPQPEVSYSSDLIINCMLFPLQFHQALNLWF